MQYVASHTTIPVPKIYAIHTEEDGYIYIEMAYVQGDTLDRAWSGLSTDQRNTIFADIKQHLSCLRELQPPTQDLVSSALQNPAYDCRIGARFYGPLNHDEFHSLARGHYNYFSGQDWEEYLRLALPCYETELMAERTL
jgi:hypothetical protein